MSGRVNLSKKESKYKVLISNTFIFAIGNILVKLISFFLMPLYTTILTVEEYGIAELLNNTIEIILPIATLCIIEAVFRFSIDKETDKSTLFTNSIIVLFLGSIVVGLLCILFDNYTKYEYTFLFFVLFVTTSLYKLTTQFSRGLGHTKRFALYGVINALLLVVSNIILLLLFNTGIYGYLISFSIGYGMTSVIAIIVSKEYNFFCFSFYNKKVLSKMIKYSIPSVPNMLSWWVNSLSDRYILLFCAGSEMTGIYTAAGKLPAMINIIASIFQQAWQYSTAKEINNADNGEFFLNVYKVYSFICFFFCIFILLFNKLICKILLQSEFYVAWKYVPFLFLAATFGCISTYFGTFYNAIKNNKMLMISTVIGAFFNIVLNILLIPNYGAIGAALATVISYLIIMFIRYFDVKRIIGIKIKTGSFIFQIFVLIITSVFAMSDNIIINLANIINLIVIVIINWNLVFILYNKFKEKIK